MAINIFHTPMVVVKKQNMNIFNTSIQHLLLCFTLLKRVFKRLDLAHCLCPSFRQNCYSEGATQRWSPRESIMVTQ